MAERAKRARIPEAVYSACSYFLPRLMFLQSSHAGQVHWGDVAIALQDFPTDELDLSSPKFWDTWRERWTALAETYRLKATQSATRAGKRRLNRSATGCYHWAEFMYFEDRALKTALRRQAKACFLDSLEIADAAIESGELSWEGQPLPYYLVLPAGAGPLPLPCVVLSNGLDSMTEVEVFAFAEQFLARGMAVFLFDGPGQGLDVGVNPLEPRGEWVARAIVRFLAEEARVDSQRLGYFGVSFGGYLALRVALHLGQAFRCVVNFSGGPRVAAFEQLPRRLKADFQYAFMAATADDMPERLRALELNAPEVWNTDLLSIHGAQDDIFPLQALERFTQTVDRRHTLRVYPAEAHVCLNYLNECTVELADWVANKLCPSELALTVAAE